VTLATLNRGFRVRLGLRTRIDSGLRPRRRARLRIQPMTCVWAVSTLDLNHRSTPGARACAALLEMRRVFALRSRGGLGPLIRQSRRRLRGRAVLTGHPACGQGSSIPLARYREARLRTGPVSGQLAVRPRHRGLGRTLGELPSRRCGTRRRRTGAPAVAGPGVLRGIRPGRIGRFWTIWLEAPGAGGGVGRSVHACSLVWPPGGRRAQPIGAGALPRRLSTTWTGPIPPAAVEG
jgi:hypothetical protein